MRDDELEHRLQRMRSDAEKMLLKGLTFSPELREQIRTQASAAKHKGMMRRWSRVGGRVVGACVVVMVAAVIVLHVPTPHVKTWFHHNHPTTATYEQAPEQLIHDQFGDVDKIQLQVGRFAAGPQDMVTVKLTAKQKSELLAAMEGAQLQQGGDIAPASMLYQIGFWPAGTGGMMGQYRDDGYMILPNDPKVQPGDNQANIFAPNPALAAFMNTVVGPKVDEWMKQHGKEPKSTPEAVALAFASQLTQPANAYRFCIPQLTFSANHRNDMVTFASLQAQANALNGGRYIVGNVRYGVGGNAAIVEVEVAKSNQQPRAAFEVRVDRMGTDWLITAVAKQLSFDSSFDKPAVMQAFGQHQVAVIGAMTPAPSKNTKVTMVDKQNAAAGDFEGADIIVYERAGITGPVHRQLPGKFSQGHPDPRAVQQLQNDAAFEAAIRYAKKHDGTVIVCGNSDHLLSTWLLQNVLGVKPRMIVMQSGGSASVIISYHQGRPSFQDGPTDVMNGKQMPMSPDSIEQAVNAAELQIDTGGQ